MKKLREKTEQQKNTQTHTRMATAAAANGSSIVTIKARAESHSTAHKCARPLRCICVYYMCVASMKKRRTMHSVCECLRKSLNSSKKQNIYHNHSVILPFLPVRGPHQQSRQAISSPDTQYCVHPSVRLLCKYILFLSYVNMRMCEWKDINCWLFAIEYSSLRDYGWNSRLTFFNLAPSSCSHIVNLFVYCISYAQFEWVFLVMITTIPRNVSRSRTLQLPNYSVQSRSIGSQLLCNTTVHHATRAPRVFV